MYLHKYATHTVHKYILAPTLLAREVDQDEQHPQTQPTHPNAFFFLNNGLQLDVIVCKTGLFPWTDDEKHTEKEL